VSADAHALFPSTHQAVWAEHVLVAAGLAARLVPVPRHLSSDCGYCLRLAADQCARAEALLREAGVELERVVVEPER